MKTEPLTSDMLDELRMMISIDQPPEIWIYSDLDKDVGKCVDVEAEVNDGVVYLRGDYQVVEPFYAAGGRIHLPSGGDISMSFAVPNHVERGQWLNVAGTIGLDAAYGTED